MSSEHLNQTAAELGSVLLDKVVCDDNGVGAWAEAMASSRGAPDRAGFRTRTTLPLPLPSNCRLLLKEAIGDRKGTRQSKAPSKERSSWLSCFTVLIIVLNWMSVGCHSHAPKDVPSGPPAESQQRCLAFLAGQAKRFCAADPGSTELPKSPTTPLVERIGEGRLNYHGNAVLKAAPLTAAQIRPGLPPQGVAGKAKALDGLGGDTRHFMEDPARLRLPDDMVTRPIPKPKVMVSCQAEWEVIVQMLFEAGLIRIIDDSDIPRFDGERLLRGAFGVPKPGKQVVDGRNFLRFIMDCRATNAVLAVLRGDLRSMASATSLMNVVILPTEVAVFSAEDLVAAFYLLGLPEAWHGYFTCDKFIFQFIFNF